MSWATSPSDRRSVTTPFLFRKRADSVRSDGNVVEEPISKDLISVTPPVERAVLVGAPRKGAGARRAADEPLEELAELADTAGAGIVGRHVHQIDPPQPAP